MRKNRKKNDYNKKIIGIGIIIIVTIVVGIIVFNLIPKNDEKQENINLDIEPVIYYNFKNKVRMVLREDEIFSYDTIITWPDECSGEIKKDNKEFSKENSTVIFEEGNYEIIVTAPNKEVINRKIIIDKTPPELEIVENSTGTFTINLKDINDIGILEIYKYNLETNELIEKKEIEGQDLKEKIEIQEKARYIIKCRDKVDNEITKNFKIK